jgi:excisionase family DNA binding protein
MDKRSKTTLQKEAAQALSVSLRTLENLIGRDQLPVRRVGRRVLVHRHVLEHFCAHSCGRRTSLTGKAGLVPEESSPNN